MKKIQITTKTGDQGRSRLFSGEQVSKTSLRLDAYGDLDELVCILGIARHYVKKERIKDEILSLQRMLFVVSSELATTAQKLNKLPVRIDSDHLKAFEQTVDALYQDTNIPGGFIVPGTTLASGYLDYARAVSRRCERKAVQLFENKELTNELIIVWLNRLSDYLYLMARFEEEVPTLVKELK